MLGPDNGIMSPPLRGDILILVQSFVIVCVIPSERDNVKTGDLNLDLQGQIGLEIFKILVLIFLNLPIRFLSSHLNCLLII